MTLDELIRSRNQSGTPQTILRGSGAWESGGISAGAVAALVFGAAIPVSLASSTVFTVTLTSNAAFLFSNPTGTTAPQLVVIRIINASGVPHGAGTFGTVWKVTGNVTAIATGNNRSYLFYWDGTNMWEIVRGAADVPN